MVVGQVEGGIGRMARAAAARLSIVLALVAGLCALSGCDDAPPKPGLERVVLKGERFWVEPALDDSVRIKGLGGRESIDADGGMLFVFPQSRQLEFVMRDCLVDIDIAYLDDAGRVLSMHTMVVEPRKPGESDSVYESRLKRYSSRFAARMALELRAGTLKRLGVQPQDVVELDLAGLKARAR